MSVTQTLKNGFRFGLGVFLIGFVVWGIFVLAALLSIAIYATFGIVANFVGFTP